MSRVVIKNLPKSINEQKLRKLFGQNGTITDVQLKYTKDGKFRQFAFIGFKEENEAQNAKEHFNNTYIATNKISVEYCDALGEKKSKSWSKYSTDIVKTQENIDKNASQEKHKTVTKNKEISQKQELLKKYKEDPLFKEYVDVHPRMKDMVKDEESKPLSSSTDIDNESAVQSIEENESEPEEDEEKVANNMEISDLDYMRQKQTAAKKKEPKAPKNVQLFTVKLKGLPYNCKKKDIKIFFKPNIPYSIRVPREIRGIAYAGFRTEKGLKKALLKDRSFIGGKQIDVTKYDNKNKTSSENSTNEEKDPKKLKWKNQEALLKSEENIGESGRIFFRNLSYTVTQDDIEKLFSPFGPVTEINLPIDSTSRKIKGFGTITFVMPEHAVKAYTELDGTDFQGRMLHLLPAKDKDNEDKDKVPGFTNDSKKKETKKKTWHNWNSLFLSHDAVAGVMASTYGVSKMDVLEPHGNSAAVRLALGETQIVTETRKFLENEGVILDVFSNSTVPRSKRIILVKNLPSRTEPHELQEIFGKYGVVNRIILPPSGITGIVEFEEPSEADKAYWDVAYSCFKGTMLKLEWAPDACLSKKIPRKEIKTSETSSAVLEETKDKDSKTEEKNNYVEKNVQEDDPEPNTTLFVKNLNFGTTDEVLKKHFETAGKVYSATVVTKKDKNNSSNRLSMGYGFVKYYHKASLEKALKTLQLVSLEGKSLELQRSESTLQQEVETNKKSVKRTKQNGSKILVKNIPFQANQKELEELFRTFGEIKSVRLPQKMSLANGGHRGFGFVDFVTAADAKNAFEALSQSTHLYGRRLVLEWAIADDTVEQIRKRTALHFEPTKQAHSQKKLFKLDEENDF